MTDLIKTPTPGTEEFAHFIVSHFHSLTAALRDLIGPETFGEYCTFIAGIKVTKPQEGLITCPVGNVKSSIRTIAQVAHCASIEYAKRHDIPQDKAMELVLNELKQAMLTIKPDHIITV